MAFGTGEHPTTRGVVRLLPRVVRPGMLVADLGAGSAILSIAAVKLGAARAVAVELDPEAIGNAEENVERNGVAAQATVIEGDAGVILPLLAPVDLVIANIISSVVLALLPTIAAALPAGGPAILSGILLEERPVVSEALARAGWSVEAEDVEEAWWSALIRRA
jgi:ribosomal protein L11 methyltransferase